MSAEQVLRVLRGNEPDRFVYAPNYWQWFAHHKNHGTLPSEIAHCETQLDMTRYLGLDVFSRNVYCDQRRAWYGGLAETVWDGVEAESTERMDGSDLVIDRLYRTSKGDLTERLRYVWDESTLVQEKFLLDDYASQLDAFEELVRARRWRFLSERYEDEQAKVAGDGVVVAGELHSPLKMLHFAMGPVETVYLVSDYPKRAMDMMKLHEEAQVDLVRQMAEAGVPAVMSQDNLDTMFHPPAYLEQYCASYYRRASAICHEHGALFLIHACGQQRKNLELIASMGVDGLEGVAHSPLGDIDLREAMLLTPKRFVITGGITAIETRGLRSKDEVYGYLSGLFDSLRPHASRFVLSAGCNTSVDTSWDVIRWFRDAWLEYGGLA